MKKTVLIVVVICTLILGGIFIVGFLQKQLNESSPTTTPTTQSSDTTNTSTQNTSQNVTTYTMTEIAKHSSESNCWLLINNKVYDVTKFIPDHPGGVAQIIPYCGKEATKAFDTQGGRGRPHSPTADEMLKDYFIGNLSQ